MAQDAQYWTQQYGTRSSLLGGAVIGSVTDLSASFYNPGALSLQADPSFILSADIFQLNRTSLENGTGQGFELSELGLSPAPDYVAGSFGISALEGHRFGYSFLTHQRFNFSLDGRRSRMSDLIPEEPGEEFFGGEVLFDQDMSEHWAGLTWSYAVRPALGVGVTQFFTIRNQSTRFQALAGIFDATEDLSIDGAIRAFEFTHIETLWKAGVSLDFAPLALGLTVTTPGARLYGSGSAQITVFRQSQGRAEEDVGDFLATDFQEGLPSQFGSPWAVGLGGAYDFGRTKIHGSTQWFSGVDHFVVLEPEPFEAQSLGATLRNTLSHELGGVVNVGLGLEHVFSERFVGYASFITDFSALAPAGASNLALSSWDIFHYSLGVEALIGGTELTLGLAYASGSDTVGNGAFRTLITEESLLNELSNSRLSFQRLRLILGFSL